MLDQTQHKVVDRAAHSEDKGDVIRMRESLEFDARKSSESSEYDDDGALVVRGLLAR
jgi:hypothetical protein